MSLSFLSAVEFRRRDAATRRESTVLFDVYDKRGRGDIPIFYLAKRMSELHGLDEQDLLHIFETAGQEPRDLVDAETYVELIKFLLAGDQGMISVIDLLKLRS